MQKKTFEQEKLKIFEMEETRKKYNYSWIAVF